MCQWHQAEPSCLILSDERRNAVSSVSLSWRINNSGSECSVRHFGITWLVQLHKGQCAFCLYVFLPSDPMLIHGWESRLRLSFCLDISSFWKTKKGQHNTDPHICQNQDQVSQSVQLNIQSCDRVSGHTAILSDPNQAARQTVSKAALLHSKTVLKVSQPGQFFQNIVAFSKTTH